MTGAPPTTKQPAANSTHLPPIESYRCGIQHTSYGRCWKDTNHPDSEHLSYTATRNTWTTPTQPNTPTHHQTPTSGPKRGSILTRLIGATHSASRSTTTG